MNPQTKSNTELRERRFRTQLLAWYDAHARDLPWRESLDPYRVWLSEIMLQQTRVAAVIAHYQEFLRRFPTLEKLARAREASVLAAWSGLGYYRRARMLHAAAKAVVRERNGKFPATAEGLRELPGVGRYTAAAIASIAWGEPVAVVDGNVERVLQRVSGRRLSGDEFWLAAEDLLDRERPGDFNQAMMELGATVCTAAAARGCAGLWFCPCSRSWWLIGYVPGEVLDPGRADGHDPLLRSLLPPRPGRRMGVSCPCSLSPGRSRIRTSLAAIKAMYGSRKTGLLAGGGDPGPAGPVAG